MPLQLVHGNYSQGLNPGWKQEQVEQLMRAPRLGDAVCSRLYNAAAARPAARARLAAATAAAGAPRSPAQPPRACRPPPTAHATCSGTAVLTEGRRARQQPLMRTLASGADAGAMLPMPGSPARLGACRGAAPAWLPRS